MHIEHKVIFCYSNNQFNKKHNNYVLFNDCILANKKIKKGL